MREKKESAYKTLTLAEAEVRYGQGGASALSDAELIQIALGLDSKEAIGAVAGIMLDGYQDEGIGEGMKKKVSALRELMSRINSGKRPMTCPDDIYRKIAHYAIGAEQEMMIVMSLNGAHVPISTFIATMGLVNRTIVHPREIFSRPLEEKAVAIAVAHNHPSGSTDPSDDDIRVSKRLVEAGEILGIKVLDHLIISEDGYYSMLEHGLM